MSSLTARRVIVSVIATAIGAGPLVLATAGHTEDRLRPKSADGGVHADAAVLQDGAAPPKDASMTNDGGALGDGGPILLLGKDQPDPTPLVTKDKWLFDLRYQRGEVFLLGTHPLERAAPSPTPRAFGRFALELYEGPALVERVRFDFPLLGAQAPKDGIDLTAKLVSRIGVVFPKTDRGTRLELLDRATGKRYPMPWPVTETK